MRAFNHACAIGPSDGRPAGDAHTLLSKRAHGSPRHRPPASPRAATRRARRACVLCAAFQTFKALRACGVARPVVPSVRCAPRAARRTTAAMAALDPDNASILVCGGAGVAMHTTRQLKDMGAWVWMMQRTDNNRPEIEKMMAFCVKGDALDPASVSKVFDGAQRRDSRVAGRVQG